MPPIPILSKTRQCWPDQPMPAWHHFGQLAGRPIGLALVFLMLAISLAGQPLELRRPRIDLAGTVGTRTQPLPLHYPKRVISISSHKTFNFTKSFGKPLNRAWVALRTERRLPIEKPKAGTPKCADLCPLLNVAFLGDPETSSHPMNVVAALRAFRSRLLRQLPGFPAVEASVGP